MNQLREQALLKVKELDAMIRLHDEQVRVYADLLGTSIVPDLANEVIYDELGGKIPEGLTGDLYLELPMELSVLVEETECKEVLIETFERLTRLVDFWQTIVHHERKRVLSLVQR